MKMTFSAVIHLGTCSSEAPTFREFNQRYVVNNPPDQIKKHAWSHASNLTYTIGSAALAAT